VTPPERLCSELRSLRDRGLSFTVAWPVAMSRALRGERAATACFWREVWRDQRRVWACAYSRQPWPANQRPVLTQFDDDRSVPATRVPPAPVAA
jgi:hypothetical protein